MTFGISGSIPSALTAIGSTTLGSAATTITLTGLNLSSHKFYLVQVRTKGNVAAVNTISFYFNSTTATDYYTSQNGGARANNAAIWSMPASGGNSTYHIITSDIDGYPVVYSHCQDYNANSASFKEYSVVTGLTATTNVTQITLSGTQANGFGAGTFIKVWAIQ